jgi:hypothetical protein
MRASACKSISAYWLPGSTIPARATEAIGVLYREIEGAADATEIAEGRHASGVTPGGKSGPAAPDGMRHVLNDYTGWFAGDAEMAGSYFGYDGPCPPWNDERLHHYVFTLSALDMPALVVSGNLDGSTVHQALGYRATGVRRPHLPASDTTADGRPIRRSSARQSSTSVRHSALKRSRPSLVSRS